MAKTIKEDPVDKKLAASAAGVDDEELRELDASSLSFDDFQSIPESAAVAAHPFQGYPEPKILIDAEIGEISSTSIIALHPNQYVFQDRSGKGQTIKGRGRKRDKIVDLKTFHSRVVRMAGGRASDVVFDRTLELKEGQAVKYAIVPDHAARAQICFKIVKGKIRVDNRYLLLDGAQKSRLREVFRRIHYQQMQAERNANDFDAGTGKFANAE